MDRETLFLDPDEAADKLKSGEITPIWIYEIDRVVCHPSLARTESHRDKAP